MNPTGPRFSKRLLIKSPLIISVFFIELMGKIADFLFIFIQVETNEGR